MRWLLLAAVGMIAGCRGSDVLPITGRVTLDGRPLPGAVVVFQPVEGPNNPGMGSSGKTDANGYFELRQILPDRAGAVRGRHIVRITLASTAGVSEGNPGIERLPDRYNKESTLKWNVVPDDPNPVIFALTSGP